MNLVERLEGRCLLSVFTVTTTADSGPGSLRQAILSANASAGRDEIVFDVPDQPGAVQKIRPTSPLPPITQPTGLDATTQPGYAGSPLVEVDGSDAGSFADGLVLGTGSSGSVVRGLAVTRFDRNGIVAGGQDVRLEANHVGTTPAGDAAAGNGGAGVRVTGGRVLVGGTAVAQRNLISGNGSAGVWVSGGDATIHGNYIGTDAAGGRSLGNGGAGVFVEVRGAQVGGTQVGGAEAGAGNLISGNLASGVRVGAQAVATVLGNRIGTDAFGARAVPNGLSAASTYRDGVTGEYSATLVIGGATASARNVISGNLGAGVAVLGTGNVVIRGNYVGTDATGDSAVGNAGDGLYFGNLPGPTGVPTTRYVVGNLISGNGANGMRVLAAPDSQVSFTVTGNFVGTNAAGAAPLGNTGTGVLIEGGTATIGDTTTGIPRDPAPGTGRNVISANGRHGVQVVNGRAVVGNNHVGTDVTGTVALGNGGHGAYFENSTGNLGGSSRGTGAPGNLISANRGNGVLIVGPTSGSSIRFGLDVRGNRIGTDAAADAANRALGNAGNGVAVVNAAAVQVGGDGDDVGLAANTIAFNGGSGVLVEGTDPANSSSATKAQILRNSIFSNARLGIDLAGNDGASGVTPNDVGDADRGPNGLLNYPVIAFAMTRPDPGGGITVRATVGTAGTYRVEFFSSPLSDPSGFGEGRTYLGFADVTVAGTAPAVVTVQLPAVPVGSYVTATATSGRMTSEFSPVVAVQASRPTAVVGRHLVSAGVVTSTAAGKRALLPGETPTFDNVTAYSQGINGVAVDVFNLASPGQVVSNDFGFRVGTGGDPATWPATVMPTQVLPGGGTGGSDRVRFGAPSTSIRNRWIQVTVKANPRTGLTRPDVFYFGSLVGETGDEGSPFRVTALDVAAVKRALGTTDASLIPRYDFNRDGLVNSLDLAVVKGNLGSRLDPPGAVAVAPAAPGTSIEAGAAAGKESVWQALLREDGFAA